MDLSLYAIPVSTIIIGLSVGFIKYSEYVQNRCLTNTNLIIRQNDQICFMLKRLVELNNKISKLELEFTTLSTKQYFTYDDEELEDEELEEDELDSSKLIKDEFVKELEVNDELVKELEASSELVAKDEVFEIINTITTTTNTPAIASKKSGWFSF